MRTPEEIVSKTFKHYLVGPGPDDSANMRAWALSCVHLAQQECAQEIERLKEEIKVSHEAVEALMKSERGLEAQLLTSRQEGINEGLERAAREFEETSDKGHGLALRPRQIVKRVRSLKPEVKP
jgi:hypothetical protein